MTGFIVKSNFFGDFKTGDNINYNLEILKYLYGIYDSSNVTNKRLLVKPIVILLASIDEAILHDLHRRIKLNVIEGVEGISIDILDRIRNKKIDEFKKYIESARNNDFFDLKHTKFYEKLDKLRLIRNRIHIQNSKFYEPRDEFDIFDETAKKLAEICTEIVVKTMRRKYARPEYVGAYVSNLWFPWSAYFDNL